MTRQVEFDIALSFAGEDREYVDQVAHILKGKGISLFYDKFEEANLWGKNLYDYLSDIYQNKALYTIMFISENYNKNFGQITKDNPCRVEPFRKIKNIFYP